MIMTIIRYYINALASLALLSLIFIFFNRVNAYNAPQIILSEEKSYFLFSCQHGNSLNHYLNVIMNSLYSVYKSPYRTRIRIVMPLLKSGSNIFGEMFENTLDFDFIDYSEFMRATNVKSILYESSFYAVDHHSVLDAMNHRFEPRFFQTWHIDVKVGLIKNQPCGNLKWFDLAYEDCVGWDSTLGKATKNCKAFVLPPIFTNLRNCSALPFSYKEWSQFRSRFFVPTEKYQKAVIANLGTMQPPVLASFLHFPSIGFGFKLYSKHYGPWRDGSLPNNFSTPLFVERTKWLHTCLEQNHGWKRAKSLYLLGSPRLIEKLREPLESLGMKIYTRSFSDGLNAVFLDQLVALAADYFHSSYLSTLAVNTAEARLGKGAHSNQYLPECLPYYAKVYNADMQSSPCSTDQIEPQHDP